VHTRTIYLDRLAPFMGKPMVKVICGLRRVGKSYLLRQVMDALKDRGFRKQQILHVDKESLEYDHIRSYMDLYDLAKTSVLKQEGPKAILLDEVQEIEEWERAVSSFSSQEDVDIYLTGSNAHLFSSELATLLSGRYIEVPVYSLGLSEYLQFRGEEAGDPRHEFSQHVRYGGLPAIHHFQLEDEIVFQYIGSVFNTILLKDIVRRHAIRNVALLERIARYLFDNIGNITSAKRIADYLKAERIKVGVDTVQNYLRYFEEAQIAHKVSRFDLKGKELLAIHEKYYLGDVGLRHAQLGYREGDISGILENVVFLELIRRGYQVNIGKLGDREIDFIATRQGETCYIQVAYLLASPDTVEREFGPLMQIKDNYPKLVLSMDPLFGDDINGIKRMHIVDFLLS